MSQSLTLPLTVTTLNTTQHNTTQHNTTQLDNMLGDAFGDIGTLDTPAAEGDASSVETSSTPDEPLAPTGPGAQNRYFPKDLK